MVREKISVWLHWSLVLIVLLDLTVCSVIGASTTNTLFVATSNPLPNLVVSNIAGGQVGLVLQAEAGIPHIIESSPDLKHWTSVTTNSDDNTNRLISLSAPTANTFYRASRNPLPIFTYALAAKSAISLKGLNIVSDSWNSHDPNQSTNGQYDGYAGTNGDIAVAAGFASIGNSVINGDAYLGPDAVLVLSSQGKITGQTHDNSYLSFPDIALPNTDTNGNSIVWTVAPGTSSTHSFTNSGYYLINDNGSLSVAPGVEVTLLVNVTSYSPSAITIMGGTTNAGTIVMYQPSGSVALGQSNTAGAASNRPENFVYCGLPGVTQVTIGSGTLFVGLIYATGATSSFLSGGSGLNFIGTCIASNITINGQVACHYDTSLRTNWPCR